MIEEAVILSLAITALYICFQQGMVLGWFRIMVANAFDRWFGKRASRYIQKPLWDCLVCMSSVWGLALSFLIWGRVNFIVILLVCGILVLLSKIVEDEAIA